MTSIPETLRHDAGAYAHCSYCGRYSDDPRALGDEWKQPVCECGNKHGWSGSFVPPTPASIWNRPEEKD